MKKRDLAIINSISTFKFLTTEQIMELHFPNIKHPRVVANRVLRRLRLNNQIAAITDRSFQSYIYYLPDSSVKPTSQKREHFLKIADTCISMKKHSEVTNIQIENMIKGSEEFGLIPDIVCNWLDNNWCIEVQNSFYNLKQIEKKLNRYQRYYKSNKWKEVFPERFPNILIIGKVNSKFDKNKYSFAVNWVTDLSVLEPTIAHYKASKLSKVKEGTKQVKTPNKPILKVSQPIKSNGGISFKLK